MGPEALCFRVDRLSVRACVRSAQWRMHSPTGSSRTSSLTELWLNSTRPSAGLRHWRTLSGQVGSGRARLVEFSYCGACCVSSLTADGVRSVTTNMTAYDDGDCSAAIRLQCRADGNPTARYSWREWWPGSRRTTGQVYHVDCSARGDALTVQCQASNSVGQRSYVAASRNVTLNVSAACCHGT